MEPLLHFSRKQFGALPALTVADIWAWKTFIDYILTLVLSKVRCWAFGPANRAKQLPMNVSPNYLGSVKRDTNAQV